MSNLVDTLEEIENCFLSNFHNVSVLIETLIELDNFIENTADEINLGLINALKKPVLNQQLHNSKYKTDTLKNARLNQTQGDDIK